MAQSFVDQRHTASQSSGQSWSAAFRRSPAGCRLKPELQQPVAVEGFALAEPMAREITGEGEMAGRTFNVAAP